VIEITLVTTDRLGNTEIKLSGHQDVLHSIWVG